MLPDTIRPLEALASNLWWCWDANARAMWASIDPHRWRNSHHNPTALLAEVEPERWAELAASPDFTAAVHRVHEAFQAYMSRPTWYGNHTSAPQQVAYFSMEFGLHASLRTYSGGLGVLAGDHIKSASDLGLPFTGVSLLWNHGYFKQVIDDGRQLAAPHPNRLERLPVQPCLDARGRQRSVDVVIGREVAHARLFELHVGRTRLILLDTDHAANPPQLRGLTHQLYGGDDRTRIQQEVLLGIGGVKALRALGVDADVFHLNEGHCAFAALELLREQTARHVSWPKALESVRSRCRFTTHTPVPAGHDRFPFALVDETLGRWEAASGWLQGTIMDLGREHPGDWDEPLVMTVLALRLASATNGVSERHGEVSRDMWEHLWPTHTAPEVPIGHITNGVHTGTWMAGAIQRLFDEHLPGWRSNLADPEFWADGCAAIPDEVLWQTRSDLRANLCQFIENRTGVRFDPHEPTVGFARRFATYKRGDLLFSDPDRLAALLERFPLQVVFSGKAHPRDIPGQDMLARVIRWSDDRRFRGRVAFLPDYDMHIGAQLTRGVDVWLNNPRRPREASGTSGQKVCLNLGLNLSVLDGWWMEGYDGTNGWAIGDTHVAADDAAMDAEDAEALYRTLEDQVARDWNDRDGSGIPRAWVQRIRRCLATCVWRFSAERMVRDYITEVYTPQP